MVCCDDEEKIGSGRALASKRKQGCVVTRKLAEDVANSIEIWEDGYELKGGWKEAMKMNWMSQGCDKAGDVGFVG